MVMWEYLVTVAWKNRKNGRYFTEDLVNFSCMLCMLSPSFYQPTSVHWQDFHWELLSWHMNAWVLCRTFTELVFHYIKSVLFNFTLPTWINSYCSPHEATRQLGCSQLLTSALCAQPGCCMPIFDETQGKPCRWLLHRHGTFPILIYISFSRVLGYSVSRCTYST